MATAYCKLLFQVLSSISEELLGDSVDNNIIEFPAVIEPGPKERNSELIEIYQTIKLAALKKFALNGFALGGLINGVTRSAKSLRSIILL